MIFLLNDFEILSVLRNMKIIGIFTRLAIRDNEYLVNHPQGSSYDHTIAKNEMSMVIDIFLNTLPDSYVEIASENIKYINNRQNSKQEKG